MDPKKNLQRISKLLLKGMLPLPGSLKKEHVLHGRYLLKYKKAPFHTLNIKYLFGGSLLFNFPQK